MKVVINSPNGSGDPKVKVRETILGQTEKTSSVPVLEQGDIVPEAGPYGVRTKNGIKVVYMGAGKRFLGVGGCIRCNGHTFLGVLLGGEPHLHWRAVLPKEAR